MKIVVGMSGGVDSSVAALLLQRQGHSVAGITMKIWRGDPLTSMPKGNACYGPDEAETIEQTRQVCRTLGIEYRVFDCSERYEAIVLDYFKKEYRCGRTPNPCIRCNQEMKFGVLPALARSAGLCFDVFATGHYARIEYDQARGRYFLKKGVDGRKDQSYFLYRLSQEQLAAAVFPLGGMRKEEVRALARAEGLAVSDKEESQDFYGGSYGDLIGEKNRRGDIVDASGRVLGSHEGIWKYTIGQRKGLGIAYSEPLYVQRIDAERNRIVVGVERESRRAVFTVADCTWTAFEAPSGGFFAKVKIRSATPEAGARIETLGRGAVRVTFDEPRTGITPGQSAVVYDGDVVAGGGIIDRVER